MGKRIIFLWMAFVGIVFMSFLAFNVKQSLAFEKPEKIPGNYEGKWYGIFCNDVEPTDMTGVAYGEAFPNQKIIKSWGYKAKPIAEIKDLLPEQFYNMCTHPDLWGPIRINETEFIPLEKWPGEHQRLRREATERNKGKAYLDEKGYLRGYVNGFPFPDTENGIEMAWNFVCSRNYGEELLAQFYTAVTDKKGHTRHSVAEQCYLWWIGRLHGEHVPEIRPNPNNYRFFTTMGFKAPYDLKGLIMITHRYASPDKQDDMWMYIPSLRRARRMSTAQRWDKMPGGQDITWDAATGFQGKVTNYEWEYLGRKLLLCGRQAKDQLQEIADKPGGGTCDQLYQRVNTKVLQYIPKIVSSVSKAVMYLDPETFVCYYVDFYDKRGRPYLFYNHTWPVQGDGCVSPIGFLVTDVQRIHSSNNYTYHEYQNLDGEKAGINPKYFSMEKLKKRYPGR